VQIVTDYLRDRDGIHLARCMEVIVGGFEAPPLQSVSDASVDAAK
jgi:hypothetical protein